MNSLQVLFYSDKLHTTHLAVIHWCLLFLHQGDRVVIGVPKWSVAINASFGVFMSWKYVTLGANTLKPSSESMVHPLTPALTVAIWNSENPYYKDTSQVKISSSTTYLHHQNNNPDEHHIHSYLKRHKHHPGLDKWYIYMWLYVFVIWGGISNFMDKHAHGGLSTSEFAFGTTPGIIKLISYILWAPIYYYDVEEKFISTKEKINWWIGPTHSCGDSLI